MNKSQKNSLLIIKIILALHFILLFLFCLPDGLVNQEMRAFSNAYANPLFQGRWNLFAPEPPRQHKSLIYRYSKTDNRSEWIDLTHGVKEKHDAVRIGASTKMYHVLQNGSHYLWEFYFQHDTQRDSIKLRNMQHLLFEKIRNEAGAYPDEVEMALLLESSPDFHDGSIKSDTLFFNAFSHE
ncbi:MAG: DUF5819 family protein [Bacteroidota bacterium]